MTEGKPITTREEYEAEMRRSKEVVSAALDEVLTGLVGQNVQARMVISMLIARATTTAISQDLSDEFFSSMGTAANILSNKGKHREGHPPPDVLAEGLKATARVNAAAANLPPAEMVPLLVRAGVELAFEEDEMEALIDMVRDMNEIVLDVQRRRAKPH